MRERARRASASETYVFRSPNTSARTINAVPFYYLCHMALYRQYNDKILTVGMRASELRFFFAFSHSKTDISFHILLVLLTLCLRNVYIFRSQITPAGSFLSLLMVWRYIIASIQSESIKTQHFLIVHCFKLRE